MHPLTLCLVLLLLRVTVKWYNLEMWEWGNLEM
jgi:hypothetical protein